MENLGRPIGIDVKLENGRALRAEATFVVRAPGIALDVTIWPSIVWTRVAQPTEQ
jgi:hypothetical protein